MNYPKIETVYVRDPVTFKVLPSPVLRNPAFDSIRLWQVYEKADGMNIRVFWDHKALIIFGRTDNAQFKPCWMDFLRGIFTTDRFCDLPPELAPDQEAPLWLFGELIGPGINGNNHKLDHLEFRLFDVFCARWEEQSTVEQFAHHFKVKGVPYLGTYELLTTIINEVRLKQMRSQINPFSGYFEGVVARPPYELADRYRNRIMWKVKTKDFPA